MTNKMIEVEKLTEDEVKKRLNVLIDLYDTNDTWEICGLPCLLHRGDTCIRSNHVKEKEEFRVLKAYRQKIKPIVVWMKRVVAEEKEKTGWKKVFGDNDR